MQKITENVQRFAAVGQTSFLSMGGVAPWWRSVCTLVTFPFKVISSMVSEVNSSIASYKVPCWDRKESRLSFMGTITCTRRSQCNATLLPTTLSLGLLSWFVFSYYLWSSGCLITSNKKHMLKLPQTFTLLTYFSWSKRVPLLCPSSWAEDPPDPKSQLRKRCSKRPHLWLHILDWW